MDIKEQFELLKNIVNYSEYPDMKIDLSTIENIIFHTLPDSLEKNAPSNFPELYFDFKQEYERFKEFMLFDKLIGKNIVALGGGFSSGKSSFINSLIENEILPSAINPSTSVPAYLVNGDDLSAYGINTFQSKVEMKVEDVMLLSHGFGKTEGGAEITLGHLLSSLFITTPYQKFDRIAMLDTPGYSKADSVGYSAKTDEKIARTQLNSANYILWFVTADSGTITESDINFIKTLRPEIPILIIVNKADKIMPDELDEVVEKIKDTLNLKGIKYLDVLTYSSDEPEDYDRNKIIEYLDNWNNGVSESRFAYNFKVLFTKCSDYFDERLNEEKKQHNYLSHILADVTLENDDARDYLNSMDDQAKRNISHLKDLKTELKALQNEFFTEIKRIADEVNIQMPEPSEIELLDDKISNPKTVLDMYCEKHGLNSAKNINQRNKIVMTLTSVFEDITPRMNKTYGGTEYHKQLESEIGSILNISADRIHLNDCMKLNGDVIIQALEG